MRLHTVYRTAILISALLSVSPRAGTAQEQVRLEGRLVEAGTNFGIASGWVRVETGPAESGPTASAGVGGHFRFEGLAPGAYVLAAGAYGYETRRIELSLRSDTTVLIELDPAPVQLDSLRVQGRSVRLRGEVVESESGRRLMDVEVDVEGRDVIWTDSRGRFEADVAAGPPFRVLVRHFGYLPVRTIISTFQDTTLVVELEPDRAVQQMIDVQVERLQQRARPFIPSGMPPLDREFILSRGRATALDLVIERYGMRINRISCLIIDEGQYTLDRDIQGAGGGRSIGWSRRGHPGEGLDVLSHYLAPEIERIEMMEYGAFPRSWMLRLYTRDFMREMVARTGNVELARPRIIGGFGRPICK